MYLGRLCVSDGCVDYLGGSRGSCRLRAHVSMSRSLHVRYFSFGKEPTHWTHTPRQPVSTHTRAKESAIRRWRLGPYLPRVSSSEPRGAPCTSEGVGGGPLHVRRLRVLHQQQPRVAQRLLHLSDITRQAGHSASESPIRQRCSIFIGPVAISRSWHGRTALRSQWMVSCLLSLAALCTRSSSCASPAPPLSTLTLLGGGGGGGRGRASIDADMALGGTRASRRAARQ
jgi:hypothetical protein